MTAFVEQVIEQVSSFKLQKEQRGDPLLPNLKSMLFKQRTLFNDTHREKLVLTEFIIKIH